MKLVSLLLLLTVSAFAKEGTDTHGGDSCEARFASTRNEISSWIEQHGERSLKLGSVSPAQYHDRMRNYLANAQVACTHKPLRIGNSEKTCVNRDIPAGRGQILCNRDAFLRIPLRERFMLVHHEFAGLAGYEAGEASRSDYQISIQIPQFLNARGELVVRDSEKFITVLVDQQGRRWSQKLALRYSNGCRNIAGRMECDASAAEQACSALGARLPNDQDYIQLMAGFDPFVVAKPSFAFGKIGLDKLLTANAMSVAGFSNMQRAFGGTMNEAFWTSDTDEKDFTYQQFGLSFSQGKLTKANRIFPLAVRCVR